MASVPTAAAAVNARGAATAGVGRCMANGTSTAGRLRAGVLAVLALCLVAAAPAGPARAQTAGQAPAPAPAGQAVSTADVLATMRIDELLGVMRDEGLAYAASLEEELFPGRGGAEWQRAALAIYDSDTMRAQFAAAFETAVAGDAETLAAAQAFFGDARGRRILELEIEARRALLDDGAEEAARVRFADMRAKADPRVAALEDFVAAGDFVEANVQGAMNANLAFWKGLAAAGGELGSTPEEEMLADVWAQEPEVRTQTTDWLFAYLALAYGPLPDEDLAAYIAYSRTPQGKRLNIALFAAFDAVFERVSYDLGRAAGQQMMGQDL